MADEDPEQGAGDQEAGGSSTGSFMKKIFARKAEADGQGQSNPRPEQGIAQIPATVLTVEYVDDSEGMDAALKDMSERLQKMEEQANLMQETQGRLVTAINQQAKDIGKLMDSLSRRIDKLYRQVIGGTVTVTRPGGLSPEGEEEPLVASGPAAAASAAALAPDVADDPEHQNAWRVARVLVADLEAYHEDAVKEGVLYGTFYSVLREPVEKARKAYEQRVSGEIVDGYDYYSKALDELIARKRMELEEEGAL